MTTGAALPVRVFIVQPSDAPALEGDLYALGDKITGRDGKWDDYAPWLANQLGGPTFYVTALDAITSSELQSTFAASPDSFNAATSRAISAYTGDGGLEQDGWLTVAVVTGDATSLVFMSCMCNNPNAGWVCSGDGILKALRGGDCPDNNSLLWMDHRDSQGNAIWSVAPGCVAELRNTWPGSAYGDIIHEMMHAAAQLLDNSGGLMNQECVGNSEGAWQYPDTYLTDANKSLLLACPFISATGPTPPPQMYYTLTVLDPSGNGAVSPAPGGLYLYAPGESLQIAASPASGWKFDHWIVCQQGSGCITFAGNPATFTMRADYSLQAVFLPVGAQSYTLSVNVVGSGSITPSIGSHSYPAGTQVTVTATANPGWAFDHWIADGGVARAPSSLTFTMDASHTLVAVFVATTLYALTLASAGLSVDPAPVTSVPSGTGAICTYRAGTVVAVTATAPAGQLIDYWLIDGARTPAGSLNLPSDTVGILMNAAHSVGAVYKAVAATYTLNINAPPISGSGHTSPDSGSYPYPAGSSVPVTAIPSANWYFDHWILDGANAGSSIILKVTMDATHTLQAVFVGAPPVSHTLTITAQGGGATDPPLGAHSYTGGSIVTVTALPASGWQFDHWLLDGVLIDITGTHNPINVTMGADHVLQVVFTGGGGSGNNTLILLALAGAAALGAVYLSQKKQGGV